MNRLDLVDALSRLDLAGANAVVHSSLPSLGPVEGGAATVCDALVEAVGPDGTVVMPAFTYQETVLGRSESPVPFQPELPVSAEVGTIAEVFRKRPGVLRSSHPSHSFTAWGRHAKEVLSTHRDNNPLGPIKKLNVMQGSVLLLGTPLSSATAIHLAEEMSPVHYLDRAIALRTNASGFQERVIVEDIPGCSVAFDRLESRLDPACIATAPLPHGVARKIPLRYLVRLASAAPTADPKFFICESPECAGCAVKREAVARATGGAD